jgi:hypothetical protein
MTRNCLLLLLLTLTLCLCLETSKAQDHHWEPTVICSTCTPNFFAYGDSLHQILAINFGKGDPLVPHYTTDGGRSWFARESDDDWTFASKSGYDFSSYFSEGLYYLFRGSIVKVSRDGGRTWTGRSPLSNTCPAECSTAHQG